MRITALFVLVAAIVQRVIASGRLRVGVALAVGTSTVGYRYVGPRATEDLRGELAPR